MTLPHALNGLSDIAADYDILLCDVWGVIHNGRESWPAACEALARFNRDHGHVVLISNSPRPGPGVVDQMDGLAVPRDAWRAVVTSGDATRRELALRAPGPAWIIGPDRDGPLYDGLGLDVARGAEDAAFISVTGMIDDETETPEDYRDRLAAGAARDLELICANPDRVVQRGDRLIWCGGALADLYESLGGRVTMAGKPFGPIYDLALRQAADLLGEPVNRSRVLCIGDGVITDVLGANRQGLDCLFIAQGIHGDAARGPDGRLDPARAADLLKAETTYARYAALDLTW
ncbi:MULTISPECIES: TIGR01459 family HAD-type hydrolase [unclassified Brevundimonas]|uniref:TIGR01459 family HAD-type hydrolase n=1 Tax=unclassified Brevundimonas TaxID=2622653 RepID=UPI0006FDAAA2|nr:MULTISPECIES: TIGR01459 family HAD-type hydrolase [unclassified Brevundimonas]KQY93667.1 HAD family hydrolase [Brevundimonas sp. Root1423]KRA28958.1 HAD family hydrolase [Brevundimonas sp. Root608]